MQKRHCRDGPQNLEDGDLALRRIAKQMGCTELEIKPLCANTVWIIESNDIAQLSVVTSHVMQARHNKHD